MTVGSYFTETDAEWYQSENGQAELIAELKRRYPDPPTNPTACPHCFEGCERCTKKGPLSR